MRNDLWKFRKLIGANEERAKERAGEKEGGGGGRRGTSKRNMKDTEGRGQIGIPG